MNEATPLNYEEPHAPGRRRTTAPTGTAMSRFPRATAFAQFRIIRMAMSPPGTLVTCWCEQATDNRVATL
jgi:hypothetical protein